jgi:predicted lactoylglutathione lyase
MAILNQLNLVVGDMGASSEFYQRIGITVTPISTGEQQPPFHAEGKLGNDFGFDLDTPSFAQTWNAAWAGRDDLVGRVVIGFRVPEREEVDRLYADLVDAGRQGLQCPFDAFWGARYAIVEDPNGIAVGLMSPIDPERRYWPPRSWSDREKLDPL